MALCFGNPVCIVPTAFAATAFVAGVTSGNLGYALRAGLIAGVTAIVGSAIASIPLGGGAYAQGDFQELYGPGYNPATDNFEAPLSQPTSNQIAVAPAGGGGSGLTPSLPSVAEVGTNVGAAGGGLVGGAVASVNAAILGTVSHVPGAAYQQQSLDNFRAGNYGAGLTSFGLAMLDAGTFWASMLIPIAPAVNAARGISVLGHYPAYVTTAESIGARYFEVPAEVWAKMSPTEQWGANTRFLDRLIARGDEIVLATPAEQTRAGSFFARELEYLTERGYTLSTDGTRLLPPAGP